MAASQTQSARSLAHDAALALDNQLCFALYSSSLTMTKLYKPHLDRLGLTYPQYLVMLALWERDLRTVSELGERLFLDSGTLTPLLKRMESAGLLMRRRDSGDERRVVVSLTAAGRRLKEAARHIPAEMACAAGCSVTEIADMTGRLQRLRATLSRGLSPRQTAKAH